MIDLSAPAIERLHTAGVDLNLLAALVAAGALQPINDRAFAIPCGRPDGSTDTYYWAVVATPEPWAADQQPATWWPVGKDGSTAIVVVGAEAGLALASTLFAVGDDGALRRRANLPGVLADAVPVVLPETHPEIPLEFVCSDEAPAQLIAELTLDADFDLAFLAMVVETPSGLMFAELPTKTKTFIHACASTGAAVGLTVAPVPLPSGVRLGDSSQFPGHGRRYALAGVLEFWRLVALHPPPTEGGDPP